MRMFNSSRAKRFFELHPHVETYNGYEIRQASNGVFMVDAAIGIYGTTSNYIEACKEFIDKLVLLGIKQYDDEAVSRYIFGIEPYNKPYNK